MNRPVWLSLRGIDGRNIEAQMAWENASNYRFVAATQLRRILENNFLQAAPDHDKQKIAAVLGMNAEEYSQLRTMQDAQATADAHFYLNCWRIVALNIYRLAKAVPDPDLKRLLSEQQCVENQKKNGLYFGDATQSLTLGWYAQGRDDFEHIDERIFGGKNWEKTRASSDRIRDLTGTPKPKDAKYYPGPFFDGTHMIIGDRTWEITAESHSVLNRVVERVREIGDRRLAQDNEKTASDT